MCSRCAKAAVYSHNLKKCQDSSAAVGICLVASRRPFEMVVQLRRVVGSSVFSIVLVHLS